MRVRGGSESRGGVLGRMFMLGDRKLVRCRADEFERIREGQDFKGWR